MKSFIIFFLGLTACAAPQPKEVPKKEAAPAPSPPTSPKEVTLPPIEVRGGAPVMATIDPKTLKVTYHKGADPKAFAEEMVKHWAESQTRLGECLSQVNELKKGEPKK